MLTYILRLLVLQVMTDDYKKNADSNAFLKRLNIHLEELSTTENGKLLVFNQPAYDITIVPNEITQLDTTDLV